jgi:hypothetical protein
MSVRIVRLRNGEDVICDLYEVTTKEEPDKAVAFQLSEPYNISMYEADHDIDVIIDDEGDVVEPEEGEMQGKIQKINQPEIDMRPWAPLSKAKKILLKMEEVVTAYETYDEVIEKYKELVEASHGRGTDDGADKTGPSETET